MKLLQWRRAVQREGGDDVVWPSCRGHRDRDITDTVSGHSIVVDDRCEEVSGEPV
jgi:hypothetical protein